MQHTIPIEALSHQHGPQVKVMAQAIEACVHCGFCLSVCPTYKLLNEEMDSPRGRIVLMKSVLEGGIAAEEALPYLDRCLGCQACVTACPSGVAYGDLITSFRAQAEEQRSRRPLKRLQRRLIQETLPYPKRFRLAAGIGALARPLKAALPAELQGMLALLPERMPSSQPLPEFTPATGPRRARVALLAGCVQQALAPEINQATLRVLAQNGVEVVIPPGQGCCGALAMHIGARAQALELGRQNLSAFPQDVDAILTNAAGCGSGMKEYPLLFQGTPESEPAQAFASRVQDLSEFLLALGLLPPPALSQPTRLVYHDACHLAHAQAITAAPRLLLQAIPNLTLLEASEAGMCCGSAGVYNIEQPELADQLGRRKAEDLLHSGAELVATSNIGCMVQIRNALKGLGSDLPVVHFIEILDQAYSGD